MKHFQFIPSIFPFFASRAKIKIVKYNLKCKYGLKNTNGEWKKNPEFDLITDNHTLSRYTHFSEFNIGCENQNSTVSHEVIDYFIRIIYRDLNKKLKKELLPIC